MERRDFLKAGTAAAALAMSPFSGWAEEERANGAPYAEKLGWKLGCQLYSFHTKTFEEAIQMTASLGLKFAEAYPGHLLAPNKKLSNLSPEDKKLVQKILADNGVKLTGWGVAGCDRKTFEFAKEMGIEYLTCEPAPNSKAYDELDKLVAEYNIKISVHNHPKPSPYWNYETELKLFQDHDPRIGACVDSNHFIRSGLDPIKAIRALKGRIISFHFGDVLSDFSDTPLGTGIGRVAEQLKELKKQGFKGYFPLENEKNPGKNFAAMTASVKYFNEVAKNL
ncbi:MAG: sugar phosphate isomerase/epimerase [Planctomycetia bacterium]|nr:sugar phosphate isomerase/epimerase [Planctomycetia bacterium]